MARRYVHSEPTSRLAIWARRMAGFAFAASFLAVIIVRSGLLEIQPALATFGGALVIAVVALILALAAFVVIWLEGLGGMGAALSAMVISLALLAYPGLYAAEQQRAAYPDIGPLGAGATPQAAYDAALAIVTKRRWRIVEARTPQAGRRDGRIEAVARTPIMGFRDDVIVRVRPDGDGSRIDVRSSSRYGTFDFGANASRIRSLLDDVEDAIAAQKAARQPAPPTSKKGAPPAKKDKKK